MTRSDQHQFGSHFAHRLREVLFKLLIEHSGGKRGHLADELDIPLDALSEFLGGRRTTSRKRQGSPSQLVFHVNTLANLQRLLPGGLGDIVPHRSVVEHLANGDRVTLVYAAKSIKGVDYFSRWDVEGTAHVSNGISALRQPAKARSIELNPVVLPRKDAARRDLVTEWVHRLVTSQALGHVVILGSERANPVATAALQVLFPDEVPFRFRWPDRFKTQTDFSHPTSPWGYFGSTTGALEVYTGAQDKNDKQKPMIAECTETREYGVLCTGLVKGKTPRLIVIAAGLSGPSTLAVCNVLDRVQTNLVPGQVTCSYVEAQIKPRAEEHGGDRRDLGTFKLVKVSSDRRRLIDA